MVLGLEWGERVWQLSSIGGKLYVEPRGVRARALLDRPLVYHKG